MIKKVSRSRPGWNERFNVISRNNLGKAHPYFRVTCNKFNPNIELLR